MKPGAALGPYRIDREVGSGGMGKVYAATSDASARAVGPGVTVALKVVHPHLLEAPGFFKPFLREGEIGQAVRHPNVARTFDCDQVVLGGAAHAFLVMEYVEGQTLRELLDELRRVPEELCRHIGREVSKGLAANLCCPPRLRVRFGVQKSMASCEIQTVRSPRSTRPRSYSVQLPTRYFVLNLG